MPNWCENDLRIEGPREVIEEFVRFATGETEFDFERFRPYPEEFRRLDEIAEAWDREHAGKTWHVSDPRPCDGYNSGGEDWRNANWGTKWLAHRVERCDPVPVSDAGLVELVYHFCTAWGPPTPLIEHAAQLFPALAFELRYFESLGAFNGMLCCSEGEITFDESGPYFGDRGG
jgi:hypothetical protein